MKDQRQNIERLAADCHFHIIDPQRFPLAENVGYHPRADETGSYEEFKDCIDAHQISHGLAVQPSGYGFNNTALLDAIRQSNGRLKGIAVVAPGSVEDELHELKDRGIVGLRFNLIDFDPSGLAGEKVSHLLETMRDLDWFADIQCRARAFVQIEPLLRRTGVRVLIDHLGRPDLQSGINEIGFKTILTMADTGRAVVKLSGAFRESRLAYPYSDLDPFAEAILNAYTPDNCIWGSDWPFLNMDPKPDYGKTLGCLERWLPDETRRRKVFWETPRRLFNFKQFSTDPP
jgi:predicted TIM-barrel fold metal-dependent hydrolase